MSSTAPRRIAGPAGAAAAALWVVAAFAIVCAGILTVAGACGNAGIQSLTLGLTGAVSMASGALLAWRGTFPAGRAPAPPVRYRQIVGAALICWGAGQILNGVTHDGFPAPGDVIAVVAAPLGAWGVLRVPRLFGRHPVWRPGVDSVLLGVTLALPVWHFGFASVLTGQPFGATILMAVVVLVADLAVICFAALAWLRDLDQHLLVMAVGASCFTLGDLVMMHAGLAPSHPWPWWAAVPWCLAWPLIAYGLLHYEPRAKDEDPGDAVDPEARGIMFTSTASLVLMMISLAALLVDARTDRVALVLVMLAVIVFGGREVLNNRFRMALLHRLNEEATADPLTGLANRRVLQAAMSRLQPGESWCLLTVDLDGFKDVNDLLGHATGDKLLVAVAHRLAAAVPVNALVSRIGGDEFAVLLPGSIALGTRVGETVVAAVRRSAVDVEGVARVEVSASVGVAAVDGRAVADIGIGVGSDVASGAGTGTDTAGMRTAGIHTAGMGASGVGTPGVDAAGRRAHGAAGGDVVVDMPCGIWRMAKTDELPEPPAPVRTVVDPLGALSASGAALRVAKATGRNRVEVYDAAVARIRQRRLRVEERLRSAVEAGAISVQFQPIVDLRRGVVTGAEALARWHDPQLGRVGPEEFITVAEQTGLVVDIGEQILQATLGSGVAAGLFDRGLRINCNVSPVQLRVPGFHQVVQQAITSHGVPREQLVIEVTEQVLVEEGQAAQTLHRLAALGLTIAIDDFGTGYSALGYLQRLPASILKIDRALTSSLVAEPRSRAITRAVLDLSRTVGVSVVVEGVETSQVDDLVRRMGVGFGQGLHYGHAMSAPDLASMTDRLSSTAS